LQIIFENNFEKCVVYIDDGYSGTNFNRPDFQQMLEDIKLGKIDCVVTKDLSRLGRNYSRVGYYVDEFFPTHNVRFIALLDGTDTIKDEKDFSAFRNVMNEFYPKDVSKKVKQVKRAGCEKGWFMGSQAAYGYRKSPEDKHILVIDNEVAPIVRRIFNDFVNGKSGRQIADELNAEGVLSPQAYYQSWHNRPIKANGWGSQTILKLVEKQVYIGHLEQCTRENLSFKNKYKKQVPKDKWVISKNTHEALISQEIWDKAQKLRTGKTHFRKNSGKRAESVFTGQIKCADCGKSMSATSKNGVLTYKCGTYSNKGKTACSAHHIREDVLQEIVLSQVKEFSDFANGDKGKLVKAVLAILAKDEAVGSRFAKEQLAKTNKKILEINSTIKNLYVDKTKGAISEKIFANMLLDFEKELAVLEEKEKSLNHELASLKVSQESGEKWAKLANKYAKLNTLTKPMAQALVDTITVSAIYEKDGKKTQDVEIYYNFVGCLDKAKNAKQLSNIA
jgi:DNA invertase Pin-like site-specific DNA recombinase